MSLLEASFDLMHNPAFDVKKRSADMMPTPFVLNDAVIIRERIKPSPVEKAPIVLQPVALETPVPVVATDTIPDPDGEN